MVGKLVVPTDEAQFSSTWASPTSCLSVLKADVSVFYNLDSEVTHFPYILLLHTSVVEGYNTGLEYLNQGPLGGHHGRWLWTLEKEDNDNNNQKFRDMYDVSGTVLSSQ